jgi:DNA invertase Pin-like site-specific DNA recombinase
MLVGYARVSTGQQNLDLQLDALAKAGCTKIFKDKISGATSERKGLTDALSFMRESDTLVVWKLDRLGRTLKHLIATIEDLNKRGIEFKSLKENLDTSTSSGKLIFNVMGALAEFERDIIRERVNAGLAAARARGKLGGRKRLLDKKTAELLIKLYNAKEQSATELAKTFGISRSVLYEYVNRVQAESEAA